MFIWRARGPWQVGDEDDPTLWDIHGTFRCDVSWPHLGRKNSRESQSGCQSATAANGWRLTFFLFLTDIGLVGMLSIMGFCPFLATSLDSVDQKSSVSKAASVVMLRWTIRLWPSSEHLKWFSNQGNPGIHSFGMTSTLLGWQLPKAPTILTNAKASRKALCKKTPFVSKYLPSGC